MRNWNIPSITNLTQSFCVYYLPMSNWNRKVRMQLYLVNASLLSTYEELKLLVWPPLDISNISLLSTYEELKHGIKIYEYIQQYGLLSTYEELKLCHSFSPLPAVCVYYLPMRNWNAKIQRHHLRHLSVYYLPMRNWNCACKRSRVGGYVFTIYLWGIETGISKINYIEGAVFTIYLWGIETVQYF